MDFCIHAQGVANGMIHLFLFVTDLNMQDIKCIFIVFDKVVILSRLLVALKLVFGFTDYENVLLDVQKECYRHQNRR